MIWLKVAWSGTLIRGCSPLSCPDSKVRNGGGGVEARSCLDWDRRLSLVSKLFRGGPGCAGFSLTVLLLSTFEKAGCCYFQHRERRNPRQSLTLGESQYERGEGGGGQVGRGSNVRCLDPSCNPPYPLVCSSSQPFPLLLCSPHPTPPLSITSTGTPSPHERLSSDGHLQEATKCPFQGEQMSKCPDNILEPLGSCPVTPVASDINLQPVSSLSGQFGVSGWFVAKSGAVIWQAQCGHCPLQI